MKKHGKIITIIGIVLAVCLMTSMGIAATDDQGITGKVLKTDSGIVIAADGANYMVVGKDLSSLVGEKVKAIGKVTEKKSGKVLTITSVKKLEE